MSWLPAQVIGLEAPPLNQRFARQGSAGPPFRMPSFSHFSCLECNLRIAPDYGRPSVEIAKGT